MQATENTLKMVDVTNLIRALLHDTLQAEMKDAVHHTRKLTTAKRLEQLDSYELVPLSEYLDNINKIKELEELKLKYSELEDKTSKEIEILKAMPDRNKLAAEMFDEISERVRNNPDNYMSISKADLELIQNHEFLKLFKAYFDKHKESEKNIPVKQKLEPKELEEFPEAETLLCEHIPK